MMEIFYSALAGAALFLTAWEVHLLHQVVEALTTMDRRLEAMARDDRDDVEAALMERLGQTLGRRYSARRG